jgi:hypothetical protein
MNGKLRFQNLFSINNKILWKIIRHHVLGLLALFLAFFSFHTEICIFKPDFEMQSYRNRNYFERKLEIYHSTNFKIIDKILEYGNKERNLKQNKRRERERESKKAKLIKSKVDFFFNL